MKNSGVTDPPKTEGELTAYEKGWMDTMVDIWHEQMVQLKAVSSGSLYGSVAGSMSVADITTIQHRFLMYGLYVAHGTGYGYRRGNGGDLKFLSDSYRKETGLDKPRKRGPGWGGGYTSGEPRQKKDWLDRKYYYSVMRMNETLAAHYGEAYQGMIVSCLDAILKTDGRVLSL